MPEPTNEELRKACEAESALCTRPDDCGIWSHSIASALLSRLDREAEAERRADELRALKPGWDSYGAAPITAAAINAALRFLRGAMRITPCSSGGVQIDGQCAEIVFGPDGEQEFDWSNRLAEAERRIDLLLEANGKLGNQVLELSEEVNARGGLLKVAREAIEKAPHSDTCESRVIMGRWFGYGKCDCWKSRALAGIAPAAPEG